MQRNYPKRNKLHLEHGESLKTRSTHITKTPTQLSKKNHIHTPTHYKPTPTHTHPHITKQVKTTTVQDTHQMK